jgi:hypothetical protein
MLYEIFGIELTLWQYALLFAACQLINVGLNTTKTLIMYKKNKISSANINAITYGFYAIVVVMTASDLPLWVTILVCIITNWVGVYISMWILERIAKRKEKNKLWEIVATIPYNIALVDQLTVILTNNDISFNVVETYNKKEHTLYIYSKNKHESKFIKEQVLDPLGSGVRYIVHEEEVKLK